MFRQMNRKRNLLQNVVLTLAILTVLFFCLFPFIQILSTSLKHQFDWGNPSLIPVKFNLKAYKELLGFGESTEKQIPEMVKKLLNNPLITNEQREKILSNYQSTHDVFPFPRFFLNTFLLSASAASVSLHWQILSLCLQSVAIWDRIMAASMLTLVPVVICFLLAMRNPGRGLAEGGVKE